MFLSKRVVFILIFQLGIISFLMSQTYRTQSISPDIYTIQVNANGNWKNYPVIELNSDDYIQINFDRISEDSYKRLRYKFVHCNADWTPSSLSDIEYLEGFNDNPIEDYAVSMNTTVEYTNFIFQVPNQDVRLKLSGNYAVLIYEDDNPDKILLTACFSVVDPQIKMDGAYSSITDIDVNKQHQQVSFTLDCSGIKVQDPINEIKTYVRQNNRLDNEKKLLKPTFIQSNKLVYEHNRDLIFEAGNEYRRFESVSYRYNGLNVQKTEFINPMYRTYIYPDKVLTNNIYSYDQDQNGRFFIRNAEVNEDNNDTEADYFIINFSLLMDEPILDRIYINGEFTNNSFSDKYLMKYDHDNRMYYASLLLKQGGYNYQYLTRKGDNYTHGMTEGNYYETENEYSIMVYHRPPGQRYDSFIGFLKIDK